MKKSLLATVAVAALIAAPAYAQRQEAPASKTEAPARAPDAIKSAPAEKAAPAQRGADSKMPDAKPADRSTTGQAAPAERPAQRDMKAGSNTKSGVNADTKSGVNADTKTGDTKAGADTKTRASGTTDTKTSADTKASGTTDTKAAAQGQAGSGANVSLTTEQKTRIRTSVLTANAPRVTSVNFSVNVGTVVPRSVRIVAVPAPLIEIHPAWRGYMYFVYNDQIVIVEPGTMRIVTILVV